jgi:hypothetical protein
MVYRQFTALSTVALLLAGNMSAIAVPADSWNLSRDIMSIPGFPTNPTPLTPSTVGTWTFMQDPSMTYNQANYLPLNSSTFPCVHPFMACWKDTNIPHLGAYLPTQTTSVGNVSFTKGLMGLHPGPKNLAIVRWKSPVANKSLKILARFSDLDPNCGTGVKWAVYQDNNPLASGTILNGNHGATVYKTIPAANVSVGTNLYFIVDPNGDYSCDSTVLDVMIATP